MSRTLLKKKAAIVGCGPVGMLGSLLFQHLGIEFVALQKFASPRSHPSAHWLSANSKAILNQIPNLNNEINSHQEPWENFRYYRYVESLFGHQLGITDHFQPSIQEKLAKSRQLFGQIPNHIPQNLLLKIMYEKIQNKQNLLFDTEITDMKQVKNQQTGRDQYLLLDNQNNPIAQVQYVILCSGVNTPLRNKLPAPLSAFHLQGKNNLMNIINIHFTSKKLADKLQQKNHNAMLHFIYGKKIIGILVNHSIQNTGTFVLQIPNYQPFVNLLQIYSARQLIGMIFEAEPVGILDDLSVIHVGKWKLQGVLADSMYKNNIFLAGDAAHAYPPAGGFGMNSGFQDIHQLVHAIYMADENQKSDSKKIFTNYSQNRRKVNSEYKAKALQNYQITKQLSISLGYSPNVLDYFSNNSMIGTILGFLPKIKGNTLEAVRLKAMQVIYRRQFLNSPALNLFFDQFDHSIQKISKIRPQIIKQVQNYGNITPNLYAREGEVSIEQINKQFGQINKQRIKFYDKSDPYFQKAQKLISSNGNVIIQ